MKTLLIESSGSHGAVALADGPEIVQTRTLSTARKHARDLVPLIQSMYVEQGWRVAETQLLVVDLGPGSYTGLRTGIATAKTIAYAAGAKVIGVDATAVLAAAAPPATSTVSVIVDAQQGQVYRATFVGASDDRRRQGEIDIVAAETWANELGEGTYVTGPALDRFQALVPSHCVVADGSSRQPCVDDLRRLALQREEIGDFDDAWTLEPLYLRDSSAQIKWDARELANRSDP